MRIVVISDTHGYIDDIIKKIKELNKIDLLIHLGDYVRDAREIERIVRIDTINVRGNCDIVDDGTKEDMVIQVMGKKILLTHGHRYNVKYGLHNLFYRAKELDVNIALFGHSHVPVSVIHDNIHIFNPGSPSLPRGNSEKSYGIIEITEKTVECTLHKIDM